MGYYKDPTGKEHKKSCGCEHNKWKFEYTPDSFHLGKVLCICGAYIKHATEKDERAFKFIDVSNYIPGSLDPVIPDMGVSDWTTEWEKPIKYSSMRDSHNQRMHEEYRGEQRQRSRAPKKHSTL